MQNSQYSHWCLLLATLLLPLTTLLAQPTIDGTFDGISIWGSPVAVADTAAGWDNARAQKLYTTEDDCYLYLGAEVTASTWMNWAFILNTTSGGGSTDSWSRSIDYLHSDTPDYIFRGHFDSYAEFHSWNGSGWSGIGNAMGSSEFAENITSALQSGWVEVRIRKSDLNYPTAGDVQFYITGDKNEHGSFDAIPDDDNAISWDESSNRTPLDQYHTGITIGGSPIVTLSPTSPTPDEMVTLTFNAACTPLAGAATVYLHSGVSTTEGSPTNFDIVVGNWGQDDGVGKMASVGPDLWEISMTSLRDYYNVPETEDVFGLNFLFRSADGSTVEDQSGQNYFNDVDPGDYFTITSPEFSPFLVETNVSTPLTFEASVNDMMTDWVLTEVDENGNQVQLISMQNDEAVYTHNITLTSTDLRYFKIQATFASSTVKHKFFQLKGYDPVTEAARPSSLEPGIHYDSNDPTKATLILHAPTFTTFKDGDGNTTGTSSTAAKNVVYVVGDFNNWQIDEAYKMNRDRDGWDGMTDMDADGDRGDYWWITLENLTPGQAYVFQYLIDGNLQVADPYAYQISDFDDKFIPESVYPNLPTYPEEAQDRASVLQTNQTDYTWTAPNFTPPSINNLNIYEMHFRDFTEEGTYQAAMEKLDYIKNLGINAIHVMPVSEFEGNNSWGYNPNFYFAADKAYGTPNDLKEFVDECHKREILVFNDLVLNHAFYSNVMARMYWNDALNRPADDSPFFNPEHKMVANPAGWWGADWNHESEHVQRMVDRALDFWLQEFNFDGYRFDFTKGFGQTAQDPGDEWASSYDQARINLLERMVDSMWVDNPNSVAIFEHLANSSEDKVLAEYGNGILMWSGVGHHNDVKGFILGYDADNTNIYNSGIYNAPGRDFAFANWMSYPESHDEERLGYELRQFGNGISTETDTTVQIAKMIDRLKIGWAFNLLFPGPRMIWQFGELGYDVNINFNGRTGEKPVRWYYHDNPDRRELYQLMATALQLRNNYDLYATTPDYGNIGLGAGNITTPRRMELHDGNGHYVIVVANLDPDAAHDVTPGYNVTGTWYRYNGDPAVDGTTYTVNNTGDIYGLQPSEVLILTNFEINLPEAESCVPERSLNADHILSKTYKTEQTITSAGTVNSTSTVVFEAGQSITLTEGFHAKANSTFTARIAGCTPAFAANEVEARTEEMATPKSEDVQLQVMPNPLNEQATVQYYLPEGGTVLLSLHDLQGRLLKTLPTGNLQAGWHQTILQANDLSGGLYFLHLQTAETTRTEKIIITE